MEKELFYSFFFLHFNEAMFRKLFSVCSIYAWARPLCLVQKWHHQIGTSQRAPVNNERMCLSFWNLCASELLITFRNSEKSVDSSGRTRKNSSEPQRMSSQHCHGTGFILDFTQKHCWICKMLTIFGNYVFIPSKPIDADQFLSPSLFARLHLTPPVISVLQITSLRGQIQRLFRVFKICA